MTLFYEVKFHYSEALKGKNDIARLRYGTINDKLKLTIYDANGTRGRSLGYKIRRLMN